MSSKFEDIFSKITLESLNTVEGLSFAEKFLKRGTSNILKDKTSLYRNHLHNLLSQAIADQGWFDQVGDIDAGIIEGLDLNATPDLFNSQTKLWGEVSITNDPQRTLKQKFNKYKNLVHNEMHLMIILYDINSSELYSFYYCPDPDGKMTETAEPHDLDPDLLIGLFNGLSLYKSLQHYNEAEEDHVYIEHPELKEYELCDEAKLFLEADDGILRGLLDKGSFDSSFEDKRELSRYIEFELNKMARKIASDSLKAKSPFKKPTTEGIVEAYASAEQKVKENYGILKKPKPSCHGIPGSIQKVPKNVDTRDYVISEFYNDLKECPHPAVLELLTAIDLNTEKLIPNRKIKIESMHAKLQKIPKDTDEYNDLLNSIQVESRKTKWDRESLHIKKGGVLERMMRIGKVSKFKPEVFTIPFWESNYSETLESEIRNKVKVYVAEEDCWTPHKEYKPLVQEGGSRYLKFLKTKFYQELASVGELADNILRLVTKPRKHSSLTTTWNKNMMALVGPGDGAMNEASTVPIIWFARTTSDSSLWMPAHIRFGDIVISNGDRLTKARLEQMMDAPRIASVSAAIACVELSKNKERDAFFAAAVLGAVSMSINIRDSELIDHIRYMVPNIFSDRSCSEDYIVDKYASPLKTMLQALIYNETKKTIFSSCNIAKKYYDVEIEYDEIVAGGVLMEIPFLGCTLDSVFQLNGLVYTAFFSCKKGLHEPRSENRKMFDKICEYEYKNFGNDLIKASFDKTSYHWFDPKFVAFTMYDMVTTYGDDKVWRHNFNKADHLKRPFELNTFSSLRSSMQSVHLLKETRMMGIKSKLNSMKYKTKHEKVSACWDQIWSDSRTRVIDHFFDSDKTILEEAIDLVDTVENPHFYATWDQKRQRTGRDREVFILDPNGKVCMFNIEATFKVVCEGVPHESITLSGNKKIVAMNIKGTQFFKTKKELKEQEVHSESLRMTADMTKWAPGDNVCKFMYAIAGLPFLKRNEKVFYINLLCTSLRKKIVLNSLTTDVIGSLVSEGHVHKDEMWSKMLGVESVDIFDKCTRLRQNYVNIRFNWLMGVLNDTSSAVHAASAHMMKRILSVNYKVHHYQPDVHSDDAAADVIVSLKENKSIELRLMDYFPRMLTESLKYACIKLSEKKTYFDRYRKEFVSEVDDNGIMKSYWQKQAIAAISGLSYIDFFRDLSEGSSKVSNLISLGGPPTVCEVTMSNVIDLSRATYSMQPGMWNDPKKFLKNLKYEDLPLELGGPLNMKLAMLPFAGIKYHTFSKMMDMVLKTIDVPSIDYVTEEHHDKLRETQGNLFCKVWVHTTEAAVKEGLVLSRLDPGIIRFKQFSAHEKTKELRLMKELKDIDKELIEEALERDPTLSFRQAEDLVEQKIKLAMLIKTPSWYSSATLQSQNALKLDRMYNVKSACCAPIKDENSPMEKGMKTIREAISEAVEVLQNRQVNLYETYLMLKTMPLLCYLYDIDNKVKFRPAGKKQLFPVQKETFLKGSLIDSSVVGLLQKVYTGETKHFLDYYKLEEEEELVNLYKDVLSEMDKKQQAVALFRIFQQVQHYSSVYFVPSPRLRGHDAILGLIGNQRSDFYNFVPRHKYDPPENKLYEGLKGKRSINLFQKCSQFACFLYRICNSEQDIQDILEKAKIDGKRIKDIVESNKRNKDIVYAAALLGHREDLYTPGPDEVVWLSAQKRSYPNWTGDFCAYMNLGTRNHPKGILILGEDDFIHECCFFAPYSQYPNIKNKLIKFCSKMNWRGGLERHIKWAESASDQTPVMVFSQYGANIQARIRKPGDNKNVKGLKVSRLPPGIDSPRFLFQDITRSGIKMTFYFRDEFSEVRTINQRITDYFEVETKAKVGAIYVKDLWDKHWFSIANGSKIDIDHLMFNCKTKKLYMSDRKIVNLKRIGHECKSLMSDLYTYEDIMEGTSRNALNTEIFSAGRPWLQTTFNIYQSLALEHHSTLSTWISLKGFLLGLTEKYNFYNIRQINMIAGHEDFNFNYGSDPYYQLILKHAQTEEAPKRFKDIDLPFNEAEWLESVKLPTGRWADLASDTEEEEGFDEESSSGGSAFSEVLF